jgi:hypothetical protein
MELKFADNAGPREIRSLFSHQRVVLREISSAVTPLDGVAVFVAFLEKLNFAGKVREHMPFRFPSPNPIEPTVNLTVFLIAVLAGAKRFAHTGLLRGDRALHALLSMPRFPTCNIRNWHYGLSAKQSALSVPILASSTTDCSAFWKSAACATL